MNSNDGRARVAVGGQTSDKLPENSVFATIAECSQFFETGSLGYSQSHLSDQFDGLELKTSNWSMQSLSVSNVESSFFNNRQNFPNGSVELDNALLMRGIDHQWHSRETLCCNGS